MKKTLLLTFVMLFMATTAGAFSEQYKVFESSRRTKTCRTNVINITNEREPLLCTYVFTPQVEGNKEGTLLFEFLLNPNNEKSVEIKDKLVAVLKDLKGPDQSRVIISLHLSNGERIYFDASDFPDWTKDEWRQLIRVSYDKSSNEWRSQIMFPLEHMWSSEQDLPMSTKRRHKYILDRLQNYSIQKLSVTDVYGRVNISLEIPFVRPTDGTFSGMIKKCKKK